MKKSLFIIILISIAGLCTYAQPITFATNTIPDSLRKNASVIKRYENIQFEVLDKERSVETIHRVYTILNEAGKGALSVEEHLSKFNEVEDAEVRLFDSSGKQIERYRQKDMRVVAANDGFSLINDSKILYLETSSNSYPVTIEIKLKRKRKGSLFFPHYQILNPGEALETSIFTARVPKEIDLRYQTYNFKLVPETGEDEKYKWYKWTSKNLSRIQYEEGSLSSYPYIRLAPNKFKMEDYEGDMTSWKNFGVWYNKLAAGLEVLPPDRVEYLKELVKNAKSDPEKIRIIYKYLQDNFRYVSIQLGIGSWKPFSADFTDKKKYGDCKALSTYMKSALAAVGVQSNTVLIFSGKNSAYVDPTFPTSSFNHMILCVPQPKDTIWLECTSNTADFGVLGDATENRFALMITDKGGFIVPTPVSKAEQNKFAVTTTVNLEEDGGGISKMQIKPVGEYKELIKYLLEEKQDDQKEIIVHYFGLKQPDDFQISKQANGEAIETHIDLSFSKVPEFVAGNKMFLSPRLYKFWSVSLPKSDKRKQDYYFDHPLHKSDTTVFKLPEGYAKEALPTVKQLKCDYATYTSNYWYDEKQNAIYSTANLTLLERKIPADKYASVKAFFDEVQKDNAQRIVVAKKN